MRDFQFGTFLVLTGLAMSALAAGARAQEVRNYTGSVLAGQQIRFDTWLNFEEGTCHDRGYSIIVLRTPPALGHISLKRVKVRSKTGPCANIPLSAVHVLYKAAGRSGVDVFNYGVQGGVAVIVNATVTVK